MPLDFPKYDPDTNALAYYDETEIAQMDIKRLGVGSEHDHITEEFGPDRSGGPRRFSCKWEERYAALVYFLGYSDVYTDSGTKKLTRLMPMIHHYGSKFNWIAVSARTTGWRYMGVIDDADFGEPVPQFERAIIEIDMQLVPFKLFDDAELGEDGELERYVTYPGHAPGGEIASETNYVQMPATFLNYATPSGTGNPSGVPIPFNIGLPETISKFKTTWHRVPEQCWGKGSDLYDMVYGDGVTRGYIGALNKTSLFGYRPLTLQLENVEARLLPDPTGLGHSWDLIHVWKAKQVPHGHLGFLYLNPSDPTNLNGYYQALAVNAGQTELDVPDIGDFDSAFHVREMRNLWMPGGEP